MRSGELDEDGRNPLAGVRVLTSKGWASRVWELRAAARLGPWGAGDPAEERAGRG